MTQKKSDIKDFRERPVISPQQHAAGGLPAIASSMKHVFSKMGLRQGVQTLLNLNQTKGFDCPGCAWPDPEDHRSMAEFCENGAKAIAEEATTRRVTPEFFSRYSLQELSQRSDFWLGQQGRLTHPMVRRLDSSHYEAISWDEAFDLISTEMGLLKSPDEAIFYTSGRTSNEAAFLYQLFVRMLGTNNLPDCSNMCHESSGAALNESIGIGKGTVTLEDFNHADCILVIGQNPGTNHPRMLTALQKASRNGCQIIAINPLKEAGLTQFNHPQEVGGLIGKGTPLATHFIQVRINGDVALLKGIMKEMVRRESVFPGKGYFGKSYFNDEFILNYTQGFEEFVADLKRTSWDLVTEVSGVDQAQIEGVAEVLLKSKRMIICWAMGLTQHKNAVANIQEAVNLLLLGGHFGRPGAGACPVRGHSNVQGDRTMGIWEKMPEAFLKCLGDEFGFNPPLKHGLDTVESILAMNEGRAKLFFGLGGNFLSASPDTHFVAGALQKCQLTVQVSTKLNRSHLVTGRSALILPCLGRTELDHQAGGLQFITVEDSMGVVRSSQGVLKPSSPHLKSEVGIVAGMAQAIFRNDPKKRSLVDWNAFSSNYGIIRDSISRVIPGFDQFNAKVGCGKSFHLPHAVRDQLEFRTSSGKAQFKVHPIERNELPKECYLLMTIRSHDQFNTTIYGLNDRYRGVSNGRRVLFMNSRDIAAESFASGMMVDLTSHFLGETRTAEKFLIVPYSIPRRCLATYFPEANSLVPIRSTAEKSNTPTYKSLVVSLKPSVCSLKPSVCL